MASLLVGFTVLPGVEITEIGLQHDGVESVFLQRPPVVAELRLLSVSVAAELAAGLKMVHQHRSPVVEALLQPVFVQVDPGSELGSVVQRSSGGCAEFREPVRGESAREAVAEEIDAERVWFPRGSGRNEPGSEERQASECDCEFCSVHACGRFHVIDAGIHLSTLLVVFRRL